MSEDPRDVLFLIQEAQRRRASDPLNSWQPTPKQKPFIEAVLKGETSENWFIAANRSGKSDAGAFIGAKLARFGDENARFAPHPGAAVAVKDRATSGWVSGLTFSLLRDTIQPKYFDNGYVPPGQTHEPFIPQREIQHFDKDGQLLKLKNGSIVGFKSADAGPAKYQGSEKDWVHFDEEHARNIYEETVIRVGARKFRFFCTATLLPPQGMVGGVTWVFGQVIRPWQRGELKHVGMFGASIYDNPFIPRDEITRLEAIYPEGSAQRRIRLGGEWIPGLAGARAYPSFDRTVNVREQPPINLRRPLAWIWDFNVEPMISLLGQRDQRVFRIYRELVLDEGSIPEMCDWFRSVHNQHLSEIWIYGDATGAIRHAQSNVGNYTVIRNHMQSYGVPLRLKVPETNPPIPTRINSVNLACRDEFGEVCLEIDPKCLELVQDLEEVLMDQSGRIKKSKNNKDPYYRRTHTSDALGYWISFDNPLQVRHGYGVQAPRRVPGPSYNFGARP